jgi:hypothetical protein
MSGQAEIADFTTEDHWSVVIFTPQTTEARDAMDDMELDSWQFVGEGFAVDRRIAWDLLDDLLANGLQVA